jgi:hypothetical protein
VGSMTSRGERPLRAGDIVEVKSAAEILGTLDGDGSLDGMPFMPEMGRHVGRRYTVTRRVEKICDTVSGGLPNSRRVRDTVLLEDLRCDGSGHGGCQAGCRLYWKESWLRRIDPGSEPESRHGDGLAQLDERARDGTRTVRDVNGAQVESYRCQATEALRATEPLGNYDLRQYIRELTSRNVGLLRFLRVAVRGVSGLVRRRLRLLGYMPLTNHGVPVPTRGELNLQPGDTVQVRSPEEIARTVDENGLTRGLSFDWEMISYCGGRYRVQDRVERIIDERTGQMIEIPSDCLILDGVVCSGECSRGRWFCPRAIYPYWREAWLRRVEDDADPSSSGRSYADLDC